jgi:hypothetical protein
VLIWARLAAFLARDCFRFIDSGDIDMLQARTKPMGKPIRTGPVAGEVSCPFNEIPTPRISHAGVCIERAGVSTCRGTIFIAEMITKYAVMATVYCTCKPPKHYAHLPNRLNRRFGPTSGTSTFYLVFHSTRDDFNRRRRDSRVFLDERFIGAIKLGSCLCMPRTF